MSNFPAGYSCSGCCKTSNSSLPQNPCTSPSECGSLIDAIVQVILNSRARAGLTAEDIFDGVGALCPELQATETEIDDTITFMARRGILKRSTSGGNFVFLVQATMSLLNPSNTRYNRPTCQFWRDRKSVATTTQESSNAAQACQLLQRCTVTLDAQMPESLNITSNWQY